MGSLGVAFDWLGVERAWQRTRGSADVLIAIVDEGVQADHPLLGSNIQRELAHPPASADAYEIPGTHAAGVVAGRHSEADEFSGVAPGARLRPVRFTTRAGTQAFDLPHAIEYAVEMGACIVNVAHSADISAPGVRRAIQYAATRNALVVCSAGANGGVAMSDDEAPNVISVLAVDEECRPLRPHARQDAVAAAHLAAPGFARVPMWRGTGHSALQGSGLAAPYVSGCAALVKSLNPGWGYLEIKEHLLSSGTPRESLADHCHNGHLLNVAHAVLGPLEHADDTRVLSWTSLNDAPLRWNLRYRSALCVNAVALYRPNGDEHWRELATARAISQKMTIPADSLRRSSGTLRLACRESNFHADDLQLTVR
ncbi:MAG TPA: S8 family serine peptidase [Steroidobacteraceae bacterium]|nr:S8 family serine peptidase [Steroidobacteraceae bacterium]